MHRFKELKVWQKSIELAVEVYKISKKFPMEERFGLTSQVTRGEVSIPSNIAEGAGRNTDGEFNHFLGIAVGSSCELETQMIIAKELNFITENDLSEITNKINDIQNMTFGLQKTLQK